MAKRIGLVLANIYQGSAVSMWKVFAEIARKSNGNALIVFPGGKLGELENDEYLRNGIFDLVTPSAVDGAVIWTSALSGAEGSPILSDFVKAKADAVPAVSLGMDVDGCPSVTFDAYHGLLSEISHMIEVHGDRKIAFLRGPETHSSAEERFSAYKDALSSHGIVFDSLLVSSPHSWSDGNKAIQELVDERNLVPGKDFTALVAASDMMLLAASEYLAAKGFSIPLSIHAAGFNDSVENVLMPVELTTVRMPIKELAAESYNLLGKLLDGETCHNMLLPCDLVIRHSCGCKELAGDGFWEKVRKRMPNQDAMQASRLIVSYLKGKGDDELLYSSCEAFIASGGDVGALFDAISILPEDISSSRRNAVHRRIVMEERRAAVDEKQRTQTLLSALNLFKRELLAARSMEAIPEIMQSSFRALGITSACLMLYKDFTYAEAVGGFIGDELTLSREIFPRSLLIPPSLSHWIDHGTFVVEPLFYGKEELGYIIIGTEWVEGYVLEDIRVSLSSALRGISLLEAANEAKDKAESAEREAEQFYATLSGGVMEPIGKIRTALVSPSRLSRQQLLKSVLDAEHLLELSLMERDELFLSFSLFPLHEILPLYGGEPLPLIEADRDKLSDALNLLIEGESYVSLTDDGFVIKGALKDSDRISREYAERVILVHSGLLRTEDGIVSIILRYPSAGGNPVRGHGFVYSGEKPDVPKLEMEPVSIQKLHSRKPAALVLSSISSEASDALLSDTLLGNIPLVIYSSPAPSVKAVLERIAESDELTVVVYGPMSLVPENLRAKARITSSLPETRKKGKEIALFTDYSIDSIRVFRSSVRHASIPVVAVKKRITSQDAEDALSVQNLIIANSSILEYDGFVSHLKTIASSGALPPMTGVLIKKAIAYFNEYAVKGISRWQVAQAVSISEDYLARIFRRELGLSPWEYLNIFRIQLATDLILNSSKTLAEIAETTGFQDQAYFSRVFSKVKGYSPGRLRKLKNIGIVQ